MKKYAISILIIFALILTLGGFTQVNAQEAVGTCNYSDSFGNSHTILNVTSSGCTQMGGSGWFANSTSSLNGKTNACAALTGVQSIICKVHQILSSVIPVLIALGIVYFVWGVVQYMIGGEEEAKKKGKDKIIYGIIGLAVIVSVWGLVNILQTTFVNSGNLSAPTLSTITTVGTSSSCSITSTSKLQDVFCYVTKIINNSIIPLIFALAIAMFVWGVVQFVLNSDEEVKKEKGKQFMLWGIIALTVMVSVWGLVSILGKTFSIETRVLPQVQPPK